MVGWTKLETAVYSVTFGYKMPNFGIEPPWKG